MTRRKWRDLFATMTFTDAEGNEVQAFDHRSGAGVVVLPRGALDLVEGVEINDMRARPKMPRLEHVKQLDANGFHGQQAAVDAMFECEQGQLRLPTAFGKTTLALRFVADCETRTLVLVHTKELMRQWIDRAKEEIPGIDVGILQGDNHTIGHLTIGMMQTVRQKYLRAGGKFWRQFGCLIVDESHHVANQSYSWLANVCPAYYRFGLSASEKRSDGWQPMVRFNLGPIIYKMDFRPQVPMEVVPIFTNFTSRYNATRWTRIVAELVRDDERNEMIAKIVGREVSSGHRVLVLSRQIKHLEMIAEKLDDVLDGTYAIVTGQLAQKKRKAYIEALRGGNLHCILGTQIFEEGVDIPRIDRIVLAFPGTEITTLQKVGRGARVAPDKYNCLVYDLVDKRVLVLARQWLQRRAWYCSVKIPIRKKTKGGKDAAKEQGRRFLHQRRVLSARGA